MKTVALNRIWKGHWFTVGELKKGGTVPDLSWQSAHQVTQILHLSDLGRTTKTLQVFIFR